MSNYYSGILSLNNTFHVDTTDLCPGQSGCSGQAGEPGIHMNVIIRGIIPRKNTVYIHCEKPNGNIWSLHEETFRQNFTSVA